MDLSLYKVEMDRMLARGGGSGGSVLIEATNMTGHGEVNVNGGDGNQKGGGGAGGRIGIHIRHQNNYGGKFTAQGGSGGNANVDEVGDGAAGTVYKYESRRGPQYRELKYNPNLNVTVFKPDHSKLKIDNGEKDVDHPAMVMEVNTTFYEFDEIQVEGYSYVHFYHPEEAVNVTVVAHELTGNKKGLIRVQNRQRLFIHIVESTHTYLDAPCSFHVDQGGEVVLPTTVVLLSEMTVLEGRMTGVEELYIERNGELRITGTAHTASLPEEAQWYSDDPFEPYTPGLITAGSLTVNNLGKVTVELTPIHAMFDIGVVEIKDGGVIQIDTHHATINTTALRIERSAEMTSTGGGYDASQGPGAGGTGSGGGYASPGGDGESSSGGSAYGSMILPSDPGSGGGRASGGSGGGHLQIQTGRDVFLDGTISSNGEDGEAQADSGGGSGGTVMINCQQITGHGLVQANGGVGKVLSSHYENGGGSGGRVAIHQRETFSFQGTVEALGAYGRHYGSAGTVYIRETLGDTVYNQLWLDNKGRTCRNHVVIDESGQGNFTFHRVHLVRKACLRTKQLPSGSATVRITLITGDGTGTLTIRNNHIAFIQTDELCTFIPANVVVESGGFLVLPLETTIQSTLQVRGALYGVEHLYVKGTVKFYNSGYSACHNCTLGSGERGQYWFTGVTVLNGGKLEIMRGRTTNLHHYSVQVRTSEYFDVDYGGEVSVGDGVVIYTLDTKVEKIAVMTANGGGYVAERGKRGPGYGSTCSGGHGGGAGHGGRGEFSCAGGTYDAECSPTWVGSGGGDCSEGGGGTGGGAMKVVSSRLLQLEGTLTADGSQASLGGGGGSGGTIWIDGLYMEGWAGTSSTGGDGSSHCYNLCSWSSSCCGTHTGGDGGGGRIRSYSPNSLPKVLRYRRTVKDSSHNSGAGTISEVNTCCSGRGVWQEDSESCTCNDGFTGLGCQVKCDNVGTCNGQGVCDTTGECECNPGFVGYRCEHQCDPTVDCSGNGVCSPYGTCVCDPCHTGSDCSILCSGHGSCDNGHCQCDSCYLGPYCHSECNGKGTCNGGECECIESWRGKLCTIAGCPGQGEDCSGRGICNAYLHECICEPGWKGEDCTVADCPGEPNCYDRGHCNSTTNPPSCQNCQEGWMGPACNNPCVHGVQEPMNSGVCVCEPCWSGKGCNSLCSGHGTCSDDNSTCICDPLSGRRGDVCEVPGCPGIEEDCTGHGDCNSGIHECECYNGWIGIGCHIPDCPGTPDCHRRGFCNTTGETPTCTNCISGWMGPACNDPCVHGVQDPMDSGNCRCYPGWAGLGCNSECSEHGVIVGGRCECDYDTGWKGELCDVPGCPGLFGLDCSGRGGCDSATHQCTCYEGWTGAGCEYADCPGSPDCAGRGMCDGSTSPPVCRNCTQGWMGPACEDPCVHGHQEPMDSGNCVCDSGWVGVGCDSECSGHGTIENGHCVCFYEEGWKGEHCDIPGCPGMSNLDCSGRGECNSALHTCVCHAGWTNIGCEDPDCPGHPDCYNRGTCNALFDPPRCTNCSLGWMGADCNDPCEHGHQEPMDSGNCVCDACYAGRGCTSECSGNGVCENGECRCSDNWRGSLCEIPGCPGEGEDCSGHGECNSVQHKCFCFPGWSGNGCETPDCPGEPDCNNRGYCNGTGRSTPICTNCQEGWMGPACDDPCVHGKQEPMDSGICKCYTCYTGYNCDSECSGNGQCVNGRCECDNWMVGNSFVGELCEQQGCPGEDCNAHGSCNSATQTCTCYPGWMGMTAAFQTAQDHQAAQVMESVYQQYHVRVSVSQTGQGKFATFPASMATTSMAQNASVRTATVV
ncbi:PREDICTED: uncharacterized protein LOC109486623 [Branchiostoma belcheri]|uniref:Uncharacterized protein LOC109486623 n=1 Tax=Branchiostoma belcheri TaxID=7741 RepID=A0A6P5AID5_BRABE|nr:PREDICTED: uncharacterized protein LOC109486623 [Branchiostoma belcheri]